MVKQKKAVMIPVEMVETISWSEEAGLKLKEIREGQVEHLPRREQQCRERRRQQEYKQGANPAAAAATTAHWAMGTPPPSRRAR